MKVTVGVEYKKTAPLESTNPLPVFRDRNHHSAAKKLHPSLREEHSQLIGYDCGSRILPYRLQDRFGCKRSLMGVKTITLENERLRAVFYPEYGGRLNSLFDKKMNKDLVHDNPVLQPGNLAIRGAWHATGIEFNCSQMGHHFLTCESLFAVRCKEENGEEFLRMYEYERCKGVYYQIDFHLPSGSQFLYMYAKIINPHDVPVSSYWWTNIALREEEGVRVFSATDEVIYYMSPEQMKQFPDYNIMAVGNLPYLDAIPGVDCSFPRNYPFATDYFFQIPKEEPMPWEAAAYPDGFVMYEASSPVLRFHKMFCWGVSVGGQRWRDFLAEPGDGDYFEIQAGLAPTQGHGLIMQPGEVIDFVQAFGSLYVEPNSLQDKPWAEAQVELNALVHENISAEDIEKLLAQYRVDGECTPEELLHQGSGYGALELRRRALVGDGWAPKGMVFPDSTLGFEQSPWLALLDQGIFPETDPAEIPASYLVNEDWMELLQKAMEKPENQHWSSWLHYGIMQAELGNFDAARESFEKSLSCKENIWALRNIAYSYRLDNDVSKAREYYARLFKLPEAFVDQGFSEEYMGLLSEEKDYETAWAFFQTIPGDLRVKERISLTAGVAALETDHLDYVETLFDRSFSIIREGENSTSDMWFRWKARKIAQERGVPYTEEILKETRRNCVPPTKMDFRMAAAIGKEDYRD